MEQVIVHSADPTALGQWWATALGWVVVHSSEDELEIRPAPDRVPGLDFVRHSEPKRAKSRLHLDFRPARSTAFVDISAYWIGSACGRELAFGTSVRSVRTLPR